jgi:hypothetical protein
MPSSVLSPPRTRRDPRDLVDLQARDYEVLQYIMEGYQETQSNVDEAIFPGTSKTPASRATRRLHAAGYVHVERWNGVGANFLRGTNHGRDALVARGVDASRLFVPQRPVAAKDLAHHLWINACRLALRKRGIADVAACWLLRRRLADIRPPAIPDLLAFPLASDGAAAGVLAVEVDMGTEPLKVFLPKLALLRDMIRGWANGKPACVLILTVGPRRILAMERRIAEQAHRIPAVILPLPTAEGRAEHRELDALMWEVLG